MGPDFDFGAYFKEKISFFFLDLGLALYRGGLKKSTFSDHARSYLILKLNISEERNGKLF